MTSPQEVVNERERQRAELSEALAKVETQECPFCDGFGKLGVTADLPGVEEMPIVKILHRMVGGGFREGWTGLHAYAREIIETFRLLRSPREAEVDHEVELVARCFYRREFCGPWSKLNEDGREVRRQLARDERAAVNREANREAANLPTLDTTSESALPIPTRDAAVEACARKILRRVDWDITADHIREIATILESHGAFTAAVEGDECVKCGDAACRGIKLVSVCKDCLTAAVEGWRPIESAPRDGTVVFAYEPGREGRMGSFRLLCADADSDWVDSRGNWRYFPTHWMPLPSPHESAT